MKQVVIMPGGFHPFHAGHYALYQQAVKAFPGADVYVAATADTSTRPFPFQIKQKLAKLAGVPSDRFVQVKSPFSAQEITAGYDPEDTALIFVRSEKDRNAVPQPAKPDAQGNLPLVTRGPRKGQPVSDYLQFYTGPENVEPMTQHAYMAYLPTVEFGPGMTSATEIRNAWPTLNEKRKTALVMSLYPKTQKNPRLAATVVKMLDTAMGVEGSLNELTNTSLKVKEPKNFVNVNARKQVTYKVMKFKSGKDTYLINFTVKGAPAFGKKQNWNAVNVSFGVREEQDDYSFGDEINTDLTARNKNQFLIYSTVINAIRKFITEYNTEIDEIIMQGAGERQAVMYQRFFQSAGKYFPGWHYDGKHSLVRDVPRQTGKKVQEQGSLNEYRDQLWTWIQSKFPRTQWPEYVQRDFLYAKAKGNKNQKDLEDFLNEIQQDFGNCKWTLTKIPITLDIFTPKTQRMIQSREGGSSNPFQVPKDAERHALQSQMIQQKGVSAEPIIVAKLANGYDLIEGWHRTIQHLKAFPQGYTGPAWVCTGATYKSESVEQGVAEGLEHYDGIEISMEKEADEIMVKAMMSGGRELGHVLFVIDGEYLAPQDLEVDERYQGQGIAATMYDYVKSKGYKIRRSGQQTDAGAGFWDKHKPGKNVWEQGVAEVSKTNVAENTDQAAVSALLKKHGWSMGRTVNGDLAFTWQGSTYVFYGERVRITSPNGKSVSVVWGQKPDWQTRPGELSFAQAVQQKLLTFDLPIWQQLDRGQINDSQALQKFKAENERQAREAIAQGVTESAGPVEAYGYVYDRRDQRVMWRKVFPSEQAAHAWADSKNATVLGMKPVSQNVAEDYVDEKK